MFCHTRAIYFCTYSNSKSIFNELLPSDTPIVHICSAASAGKTPPRQIWVLHSLVALVFFFVSSFTIIDVHSFPPFAPVSPRTTALACLCLFFANAAPCSGGLVRASAWRLFWAGAGRQLDTGHIAICALAAVEGRRAPWGVSVSAVVPGFMSCTATNPIWFVKTRLQLDQR